MKRLFLILSLFLLLFPLEMYAQIVFQFDSIIPSPQTVGDSFPVYISCVSNPNFTNWVYLDLHPSGQAYISPTQILIQNGYGSDYVTIYRGQSLCSLSVYLVTNERYYSNGFVVQPNEPKRILGLLPGETILPGYIPSKGRAGQPDFQTAGVPFNLDIYITDFWWNPVGYGSDTIHFVSDNAFPILPNDTTVISGGGQYGCILRTASSDLGNPSTYSHIFVSNITGGPEPLIADTTSGIAVRPNSFTKLLLTTPGETLLPGDTTADLTLLPGATGTPLDQTAGISFNVDVIAVDDCWNTVTSAPNDQVSISGYPISPVSGVLSNGLATIALVCSLGGIVIPFQATDVTNTLIEPSYNVPVKIVGSRYIVVSDEDTVLSSESFQIHIAYVDANGDTINDANHWVYLDTDGNGVIYPDSIQLNGGVKNLSVSYTTNIEENIHIIVSDNITLTISGSSDPVHVIPTVTPQEPVVNYPNPFGAEHKSTSISYYLERTCDVKISIYDRFGNLVRSWEKNGHLGYNYLVWDGKNNRRVKVANGAYLLAIRATYRTEIVHDYRRWIAVVK